MSNECVNTCHSSLIEAARKGCTECVKLLMDKEAGLKDNKGKSAFDYAKNEEIHKLIQDYLKNS